MPPGFVVPIAVNHETVATVLAAAGRTPGRGEDGEDPGARRDAIAALTVPPALRAALHDAYTTICPADGRVAVRSSGTAEDSAEASFAGQYRTELDVAGDDLPMAVVRCWASLWEPHAVAYRARHGLVDAAGMAVIVQAMVDADAAGVAFTADPIAAPGDGRAADRIVVESSWGLGEAVASGIVTPDRFVLHRRTGQVVHTQIAGKDRMVGPDGLVDVPDDRRELPSLTDDQVRQIGPSKPPRVGGASSAASDSCATTAAWQPPWFWP